MRRLRHGTAAAPPTPAAGAAAARAAPTPPHAAAAAAGWRWASSSCPAGRPTAAPKLWPALLKRLRAARRRPGPRCAPRRGCAPPADDAAARQWLVQRLQPYRVEAADGSAEGLLTGYFEPLIEASRTRRGAFQVPLYAPPADLATRKPYWTRQQLDTLPAAQAALRGREIAYVADPLDALVLQIQGSGRLRLQGSDGRAQTVRLAYAGHNDQPYASVGRWLIDQGELQAPTAPTGRPSRTGRGATRSACRRCCGATRASSSSARSRCPTRASARAARRACR